MMKLYLCPECRKLILGSRRVTMTCSKCGRQNLPVTGLTFLEYSEMSEKKRQQYADLWAEKERPI
ncbi:MAG: DNA-directed RNA polymerase subunit M [Lachnospiraceae bacterium]|nr:DNA-directed RNA polymerase subunit M [Lachnospiraceae bacterium]